jgi:hypothetical protein
MAKLNERISLVYDDSPYIAEDDLGRSYNYAQEGFYGEPPDIQAREWLGVEPDSEMVKDYHTPSSNAYVEKKENRKKIGCVNILVLELVLLIIVIIVLFIIAAVDYDGMCISWEAPIPNCSMSEYMRQVAALMPFGLIVLSMQYWWIAIPLIISFPLIWYLFSIWRARRLTRQIP